MNGIFRKKAGQARHVTWVAVWLSAAAGLATLGPEAHQGRESAPAGEAVEAASVSPAVARRTVGALGQVEVGGVLRNTGSGWHVLDDAGHRPSGLGAVTQTATYVEVEHLIPALQVHEVQVTVDEYYASIGLRVGASVGLTRTRIFFYLGASTTPVSPATLTAANGNLWLSGSFWV